ncbi:MAG: bifunctional phosphoribosylaminoimidazolecarboxamide formyltransferase/IMP cyclohydrolase [Alphaproteobacteria bacterium]|nr:bifunctional phosphoribosylaminoimidazolecarboxamide formyltransferase/IMP cyclohydrolase [Alphaproteobacteria bacterium]
MLLDVVSIRRALLSVSDKTGLVEFARGLARFGAALVSTGGTAVALRDAGLAVDEVADLTGFPEMLDGRVKTLHPKIHGGILGRRDDPAHAAQMAEHGIEPIDLVCVNLYPFEATLAQGADFATCVENIDIGGPALIRSAAKNHAAVTVVVDGRDYAPILAELAAHGGTTAATRARLAAAAFARTAAYDATIAGWFRDLDPAAWPVRFALAGELRQALRYGENPHQRAALYAGGGARAGVAGARQLQGKELSYNNILDTDAAYEAVAEFDQPACVIVKHGNPCGVARAPTLAEAYARALAGDPISAFGGVVAVNRPVDAALAEAIAKVFTEVLIAPAVAPEAHALLARKSDLRLLDAGALPCDTASLVVRGVAGGFLVQSRDGGAIAATDLRVVTRRGPTAAEIADLLFAWRVCKHVKSNAIVFVRNGATVGIGAGQMSRVDAARIATWKADEVARAAGETTRRTAGAVAASDAFFPFADGLIACAEAGVSAVIQPGGSKRDPEVIAEADARGLAMVFTGRRHFRH